MCIYKINFYMWLLCRSSMDLEAVQPDVPGDPCPQ